MFSGGESDDIKEFKEGDRVTLTYQIEGTIAYISSTGYAEVLFKTKCGGGYLSVNLNELRKIDKR